MKNLLLLFSATVLFSHLTIAQCTPNGSFSSPGFYPDSLIGLSPACVNVAYSEVITFVTIVDTVLQIPPIGPVIFPIDSVVIDDVVGLPATMGYSCEMPTCTVFPQVNPSSCIQFSGMPLLGDVGNHVVDIQYTAYVTVFGMVVTLAMSEDYTLTISNCSAGLEALPSNKKTLLKVTDLMGKETVIKANTPLIYIYSDGSTERRMHAE